MQKTAIKSGFPVAGAFVFEFNSESEARGTFACDTKSVLKILKDWSCHTAVIRIDGQVDMEVPLETIRLMAEFEPIVELFFADGSLPPIVLKAATQKSEDEGRWGIVRMSDERQVIMASGMAGILLSGVGINETTNWRRPEFWHPDDLRDFNRNWQRQLDVEGNGAIEYRYRIHKPGSNDPWEWYRSSYRLLRGENNVLYQVCTFIDRG